MQKQRQQQAEPLTAITFVGAITLIEGRDGLPIMVDVELFEVPALPVATVVESLEDLNFWPMHNFDL